MNQISPFVKAAVTPPGVLVWGSGMRVKRVVSILQRLIYPSAEEIINLLFIVIKW